MSKSFIILVLSISFTIPVTAQNVYEFFISSYARSRQLQEVQFDYKLNGKNLKNESSTSGEMTFVVMQDKGRYVLTATKEGYAAKYIYFNTENYPFGFEYELQEVAVVFVNLEKSEKDFQMGEVMWNHQDEHFHVVEIDSSMLVENQPKAATLDKMDQTYTLAIKNADEKYHQKFYSHAVSYYEVALFAKPNDPYATEMMAKCNEAKGRETKVFSSEAPPPKKVEAKDPNAVVVTAALLDKINRGEVTSVDASHITEDIIFSVQLGAFSLGVDASKFPGVSDLNIIPYDDFTRAFSGEFTDVNQAITRRKEMRSGKYKDAFIVKMKGNKKIGF